MGLLDSVLSVFGGKVATVDLMDAPASGDAIHAVHAVIAKMKDLEPHETRRCSTADYLELVVNGERIDEYCDYLDEIFGEPAKDFGARYRFSPAVDELVGSIGGIAKEQSIYLRRFDAGFVAYAALWPWSDPESVTLKVGVFEQPLAD